MITGWFLTFFLQGAAFLHMESKQACVDAARGINNLRYADRAICVHTSGEIAR